MPDTSPEAKRAGRLTAMLAVAENLAEYRDVLLEHGFSRLEALALVQAYQGVLLGRWKPNGD